MPPAGPTMALGGLTLSLQRAGSGNPDWLFTLEQALIQCHFVEAGGREVSGCDVSLLQTPTDPH